MTLNGGKRTEYSGERQKRNIINKKRAYIKMVFKKSIYFCINN